MLIRRLWTSPTWTSWASLGVRSLDLSLVLPFVLRSFEPADIALWHLFLSILFLQLVVESGLNTTFVRVIAYAMGGTRRLDDLRAPAPDGGEGPAWNTLAGIWSALYKSYGRLALGIGVATAILGSWALARPLALAADTEDAWRAWGIVVITSPLVLRGGVFAVFLQGVGRVAMFRRWEAMSLCVAVLASATVLVAGGDLLHLVAVRQAWAVANVGLNAWLCRRTPEHRRLRSQSTEDPAQVLAAVWPSAWRSSLGVAMTAGLMEASGIVFAQLGSSAEVASYLVAMKLVQGLNQLSLAPFYSHLPMQARLHSEGRLDQQVALARRGMRLALWTFTAGFVMLGWLGEPILKLIGSQAAFVAQPLWYVLGLAYFVERFGAMHLQLYSTTNHILWHVANGVSGMLYIVAALGLYRQVGVYAFPLAMLAGHLGFYSWFSASHSYRAFGLRFWRFESTTALPPFLAIGIYGLLLWWLGS